LRPGYSLLFELGIYLASFERFLSTIEPETQSVLLNPGPEVVILDKIEGFNPKKAKELLVSPFVIHASSFQYID